MKSQLVWLALLAIVSRLITLLLVQTPPEALQRLGGFLVLVKNYNAAFSINWPVWIFWPLTVGIICYVISQASGLWQKKDSDFFAWSLIAIGAVNNIIDRLHYGAVIDYIRLGWWPVFNLNDSMVVIGVGLLLLKQVKHKEKSKIINDSEKNNRQPAKNICTLYLVRHGETEGNAARRVQGQTDTPLTVKGLDQAREVAATFKDLSFSAIYSSDLLRAHRTAEVIKLDRELEVRTSKLLRERAYGSLEGKSIAEYRLFADEHLLRIEGLNEEQRWHYKKALDIESDQELVSRLMIYLREIALAHRGQTVLVVSHSGAMRLFLQRLKYLPEVFSKPGTLANCGYIELESDGITFEIIKVIGQKEPR